MVRPRSLPFQVLVTLRVTLLVLLVTATFLWVVLGRVHRQVEDAGRQSFSLLTRGAFGETDAIISSYLGLIDRFQEVTPLLPLHSSTTMAVLARMLLPYEHAKAVVVRRSDKEIFYVLRVDEEAPAQTAYTLGHAYDDAQGKRWADISYHTDTDVVLSHRRIHAPFLSRLSRWSIEVEQLGKLATPIYPFPGGELGMALYARLPDGVVAVTTTVRLLDNLLERVPLSANGAALMLDDQQRVVAMRLQGSHWGGLTTAQARLKPVSQLGDTPLAGIGEAIARQSADQTQLVQFGHQAHLLAWHTMLALPGTQYRLVLLSPLDDMSSVMADAQRTTWLVALGGLALVLPLTWLSAGAMARQLQRLVHDSHRIARIDFAPASPLRSRVRELQELVRAQDAMRGALATRTHTLERVSSQLARLIDVGVRMVHEPDRGQLLRAVVDAAFDISRAQAAVLYVRDEDDQLLPATAIGPTSSDALQGFDLRQPHEQPTMAVQVALSGETLVVEDIARDGREDITGGSPLADGKRRPRTAVTIPLCAPEGRVIGVMQLIDATDPETGQTLDAASPLLSLLQALAALAAVALDNHTLIDSQQQLLDTLVRTLGDAIDAKSAYTGRHCARVPELALMLAQEAHAADHGSLAQFGFHSENEWREFRIGAWLHDCGKITSPEHVIDKATKLEMVYNRLHEVRTRFEVLLRDARIEGLQDVLQGRITMAEADAAYARRAVQLAEDFAFIAACNQGGEQMAREDMARVQAIGQQRWLRHFDDRLGLSATELALRGEAVPPTLPTSEALLADQPWHVVPRDPREHHRLSEGFSMAVPEHLYRHGELYNLCVARGTLTEEERFKVNEHIIHTIRMLENAHFPERLKRVPEYAGTHHETLDGKGYPRGLAEDQLSIPARIMAIADIFEALTAADRPYKQGKSLSEAVAMLHRLSQRGKIDTELFELFLTRGVHLRYAQRFLQPGQIDTVDLHDYLRDLPPEGVGPSSATA